MRSFPRLLATSLLGVTSVAGSASFSDGAFRRRLKNEGRGKDNNGRNKKKNHPLEENTKRLPDLLIEDARRPTAALTQPPTTSPSLPPTSRTQRDPTPMPTRGEILKGKPPTENPIPKKQPLQSPSSPPSDAAQHEPTMMPDLSETFVALPIVRIGFMLEPGMSSGEIILKHILTQFMLQLIAKNFGELIVDVQTTLSVDPATGWAAAVFSGGAILPSKKTLKRAESLAVAAVHAEEKPPPSPAMFIWLFAESAIQELSSELELSGFVISDLTVKVDEITVQSAVKENGPPQLSAGPARKKRSASGGVVFVLLILFISPIIYFVLTMLVFRVVLVGRHWDRKDGKSLLSSKLATTDGDGSTHDNGIPMIVNGNSLYTDFEEDSSSDASSSTGYESLFEGPQDIKSHPLNEVLHLHLAY